MLLLWIIIAVLSLWLFYLTYLVYHQRSSAISSNSLPESEKYFQKIGLLKYNPFGDVGGEQSFILTLLDNHHDGVILNSLHSREVTRLYAKPIKDGSGDKINLSPDEKSAILKTIRN